jgi:hypothetical protein
VLCDVGERLGDDEASRRLYPGRKPAHGHGALDRHRRPGSQRVDAGAQGTPREDSREDAAGELAHLVGGSPRLLKCRGHESRRGAVGVLDRSARQLEGDDRVPKALLRSVVEVA